MNGFVKEILIPSVEQSMPVDIIPSEVMVPVDWDLGLGS